MMTTDVTTEPAIADVADSREASGPSQDGAALGPWRSFLRAHARVTRRLDEELRAEHGLSLAEYDALLQLASAPRHRLRMSVLADRVLLSRSGITRLVDRLVADGMVERTVCRTDARGAEASLTRAGLGRLRSASRTHLDGVQRYFLDAVNPNDRVVLERALDGVIDGLDSSQAGLEDACTDDA
jgi:DNA-binding MarR family transcriptional regulator